MHRGSNLTAALAGYAVGTRFDALPVPVQREAARAFLNWVGVAIGGSKEPAIAIITAQVADQGSIPQAAIIGQGVRTDPANAALVNCISSAILAYDDAYLPSVAHPSGPAAAALFAIAQSRRISGEAFLNALALSIEVQCRMANLLSLPPSKFHPALYVNGFSGPIGVAAGVGRLIGLNDEQMQWALGIAASQASGFRGTHGTMTAHFRAGHCCKVGVIAALMAEKGFNCTPDALEGVGGMLDVYADGCDPAHALADLGARHVMLENRYKPYPCGIVIHPVIDACLALRDRMPKNAKMASLRLTVNPAVLALTGKRNPRAMLEAANSVYHWAAASFLLGVAGLPQMQMDCVNAPDIAALRNTIEAAPDETLGKGEAIVDLTLTDGQHLREYTQHARGSLQRPMDDRDLEMKFHGVTKGLIPADRAADLIRICRALPDIDDVGAAIGVLLS